MYNDTGRSESRCALRLQYVDLVVSIEVVEVLPTPFISAQRLSERTVLYLLLHVGWSINDVMHQGGRGLRLL
jgi:hypothetical protein